MFTLQRVRDPLHNLIGFEANEFEAALWQVIATRPFQRLRRIKQLGFSELVYPGATHTRFAHSIGVFHVARHLMNIVRSQLGDKEFRSSRGERAVAAALVHDLGHGPFSHAFEEVGKRLSLRLAGNHEIVSDLLIRDGEVGGELNKLGSGFAEDVADVINKGPVDIYAAVVSSQFDADRLDYVQRDRIMTGSQHAGIDFAWLTSNLEVGDVPTGVDEASTGTVKTFVLGTKALYAAEAYVLGLFQLYPTIYFHKATRSAEKIFSEILVRIVNLVRDDSVRRTGLPAKHALIRFSKEPESIESILALDDAVIWGSLSLLVESRDTALSFLSRRLRDRTLFKAIDVRAQVRQLLSSSCDDTSLELENTTDRVCAAIAGRVAEARALRDPNESPTLLWDQAERQPYKQLEESKGRLNQITVKTQAGHLVDLRSLSPTVKAVETFRLARAYVPAKGHESAIAVQKLIDEGVHDAARLK